jgi:hypothetical protein
MGHTPQKQGLCIFCGRPGLSKEHVWADWQRSSVSAPPVAAIPLVLIWPGLLVALPQVLLSIVLLSLLWGALGASVLKFFYRKLTFTQLGGLCFWAILRVLAIGTALYLTVLVANVPFPKGLWGLVSLAGMCAVGWLITRDMGKFGVPKQFPGPGFKAVLGVLIISSAFVGIFTIYGLP